MNKWRENFKGKNILIYLLISLVLALLIQVIILPNKNNEYNNLKFNSINSQKQIINYTVDSNVFTAQNNDPQLLFQNINSKISAVEIDFLKPIEKDMQVQIYFTKNGENLSEKDSILYSAKKGNKKIVVEIPYDYYSVMRVDIGSNSGESFQLDNIKISESKILLWEKIISKINIINLVLLTCVTFIFTKYREKIIGKKDKNLEIIFMFFCFFMFTLWAIIQPFNSCPDEAMRYDVIKYIFQYNRLPHGGDPLILNKKWGFSYAFLPYLSGLISVLFMKIASIFTMNDQALILAARMAVICFGTGTVYYVIKISNKLFKDEEKWLFIILVSCLPQFVFLGSYMNNDMLALLSVAMMIYYLINGHEKKWDYKSNIGLGLSVSICLLSYYNAYTFVLVSVMFFIWSNIHYNIDKKIIFRKFMTVTGIVFVLAGWWFIRNIIIYNGDFLGLSTMREYSNMYAIDDLKSINHATPLKQGVTLLFMLFDMKWIHITYLSFIGCFGYMTIPIYEWMYKFFTIIIIIGVVSFIIKMINQKREKNDKFIFFLFIALAALMTIMLSIYNSYTADFQPQGRYIIACVIPLMIFVTIGIKYVFNFIDMIFKIDSKKAIVIICICCILISIICFTRIVMPQYVVL